MSLSRNDDDYRPGVGIVLFHQNRRDVLVAKRLDMRYDAWQMPQGGIDPGEDPLETAFRELEEEVGTANASVIGESADWLYNDLPEGLQCGRAATKASAKSGSPWSFTERMARSIWKQKFLNSWTGNGRRYQPSLT